MRGLLAEGAEVEDPNQCHEGEDPWRDPHGRDIQNVSPYALVFDGSCFRNLFVGLTRSEQLATSCKM